MRLSPTEVGDGSQRELQRSQSDGIWPRDGRPRCRGNDLSLRGMNVTSSNSADAWALLSTEDQEETVQTLSLFSNDDDVELLKAQNNRKPFVNRRLGAGALGSDKQITAEGKQTTEMLLQTINLNQEHSHSLPNLSDTDWQSSGGDCGHGKEDCVHGSCVNLIDLQNRLNKLECSNTTEFGNDLLKTSHDGQSPKLGECILKINQGSSRLSAVLETIPLVYIPQTRQLLTVNNNNAIKYTPTPVAHCDQNGKNEEKFVSSHVENESKMGLSELQLEDSCLLQQTNEVLSDTLSTITCDSEVVDQMETSPDSTLDRDTAYNSLFKADAASFSSLSSLSTGTGTDFSSICEDAHGFQGASIVDTDEAGFMDINLHARNSYEKTRNTSQDSGIDISKGAKPKRRGLGLGSFFTRGIFSRKPKQQSERSEETVVQESAPGWKLFGKVPPKETSPKNPQQISSEYQARQRLLHNKPAERLRKDIEVASTTALILENRPIHLPAKSPEEEQKHRLEYEAMVEAARKKELKEAKQRKKQLQQQLKLEEQLTAAVHVWNTEILPHWDNLKNSKKARDLWWQGVPPCVRGKLWKLAIGNDLNLTQELYEICVSRAKDRIRLMAETGDDNESTTEPASCKEASVELIKLDVSRTFPQLCIFQKGGPYHDLLHSLLGAYACYRPDVGYVQGMSFLAAVLILNMDVADAFICFANLLNKPCQVAFFRVDENVMKAYFSAYEVFFQENLPTLYSHFDNQNLTPDLYIIDWIFTLYSKSLPLDVASRVWDVFCRDGEEFLFRTALGILKLYEDILLNMDFIHLAQFLTKLPENIAASKLFRCIETICMSTDKRKFSQVLTSFKDNRDKESP
ncbi:TBC1 domain family member 14 isoform X1 [Lingula anatina]|uniref:TBC1 domain family member 14 isoform X1 n=1 Tax=Lingula anatina TaxID=7574 RepID=A0A1S3K087_LINAN|nr:TBC1 domain family member 14 isoform X1 [Lingula anatina]|eukprot:XP_013415686.1 TBC1 domain family member 14 isoform X1 [Lingula anatina]